MRTPAVSGLVSTRSILSHVARRSATALKKSASRRFSGILIRSRRVVRWVIRAAGRLGIRCTDLLAVSVAQSHHLVRDRVALPTSRLVRLILGARFGQHVAGHLADLGGTFTATLVERNTGFEHALRSRPNIAFQPRQNQRSQQTAGEACEHRGHDRPEPAGWAPRRPGFWFCHRLMLLACAFAMGRRGDRRPVAGAALAPTLLDLALRLLDKTARQFANSGEGLAIEHEPALDHRLGGGTEHLPDRREECRAEDHRCGAEREPGHRIALKQVV